MKYFIPTYRKQEIKTAKLFDGLDYLLFCDNQDFEKLSEKYNCYLCNPLIIESVATSTPSAVQYEDTLSM